MATARQIGFPWRSDVFTTTNDTPTVASNATLTTAAGQAGKATFSVTGRTAAGLVVGGTIVAQWQNVTTTLTLTPAYALVPVDSVGDTLNAVVIDFTTSGQIIQPRVTGIAATTIEWLVDAKYDVN